MKFIFVAINEQNWFDDKLVWNASQYGGRSWFHLQGVQADHFVWTPQFRLLK